MFKKFNNKNIKKLSILTLILMSGSFLTGCETWEQWTGSSDENVEEEIKYNYVPMSFSKFRDIPMPEGTTMDISKSTIYGDPYNWTGDLFLTAPYNFDGVFDFYNTEMTRFAWMPLGVVRGRFTIMTFLRKRRVATIQIIRDEEQGAQVIVTMVMAPKYMETYYDQYRLKQIQRGRWVIKRSDLRKMEEKGVKISDDLKNYVNTNKGTGFATLETEEARKKQFDALMTLKDLNPQFVKGANKAENEKDEDDDDEDKAVQEVEKIKDEAIKNASNIEAKAKTESENKNQVSTNDAVIFGGNADRKEVRDIDDAIFGGSNNSTKTNTATEPTNVAPNAPTNLLNNNQ